MHRIEIKLESSYLQSLNVVIDLRHPVYHLLHLLQTLSEAFDLLLHTNDPRLTIMKPISLGNKKKNLNQYSISFKNKNFKLQLTTTVPRSFCRWRTASQEECRSRPSPELRQWFSLRRDTSSESRILNLPRILACWSTPTASLSLFSLLRDPSVPEKAKIITK